MLFIASLDVGEGLVCEIDLRVDEGVDPLRE